MRTLRSKKEQVMKILTSRLIVSVTMTGLLFSGLSLADQCPNTGFPGSPIYNPITYTEACTLPGVSGAWIYGQVFFKIEQETTSYSLKNIDTEGRKINAAYAEYFIYCNPDGIRPKQV